MPLSVCASEFFNFLLPYSAFQPLVSGHYWPAPHPHPPSNQPPPSFSPLLPLKAPLSSVPSICSFQHDLTLPFLLGRSAPRSSHHRAAGTDCGSHEFSPCLHFNLSSHPDQLSPALGSTSEKTLTPRWCPGSDTGQGWPEERFAELSLDSCMSASGISS